MKKIPPLLLQTATERIVQLTHPLWIYLYGSHAYGKPNEDSDIDMLVVLRIQLKAHKHAVKIYGALRDFLRLSK